MTGITLRPYQNDDYGRIQQAWQQGADNVLYRADTGAGKTRVMAYDIAQHDEPSCLLAHRDVLVSQISMALAELGVPHNIIASRDSCRAIAKMHVEELGRCFYRPDAKAAVASVPTIVKRADLRAWASQVTRVIPDESHHSIRGGIWARAIDAFDHPRRRMLMPTASPTRADGKGLGFHADGYAHLMLQAPPMRWLINEKYLTDYRLICPTSDLTMLADVGASGDWSTKQLREAAKRSHIVGDVVRHYLQYAAGLRTLTFCTDVETAVETCAAFNAAGVPSATLTGNTDPGVRRFIISELKAGRLLNIVAVDIISEGFDLPAVECVIMARPTASLSLYMQQFGRALRLLDGKVWALIIDAVSNVVRHMGPPDRPREWSLDRRDKRAKGPLGEIQYRVCVNPAVDCFQPYERFRKCCPFCGYAPVPASRGSPAAVEGDVQELDAVTLARLRGEMVDVDRTDAAIVERLVLQRVPRLGIDRAASAQRATRDAQILLRGAMMRWGGLQRARGLTDAEMQKLWYALFGVDVLTARSLNATDSLHLKERVDVALEREIY